MAGPSKGLTKPRRARKCAGCGLEHPKGEMLRVVRSPDGAVSIDASGPHREEELIYAATPNVSAVRSKKTRSPGS